MLCIEWSSTIYSLCSNVGQQGSTILIGQPSAVTCCVQNFCINYVVSHYILSWEVSATCTGMAKGPYFMMLKPMMGNQVYFTRGQVSSGGKLNVCSNELPNKDKSEYILCTNPMYKNICVSKLHVWQ